MPGTIQKFANVRAGSRSLMHAWESRGSAIGMRSSWPVDSPSHKATHPETRHTIHPSHLVQVICGQDGGLLFGHRELLPVLRCSDRKQSHSLQFALRVLARYMGICQISFGIAANNMIQLVKELLQQ